MIECRCTDERHKTNKMKTWMLGVVLCMSIQYCQSKQTDSSSVSNQQLLTHYRWLLFDQKEQKMSGKMYVFLPNGSFLMKEYQNNQEGCIICRGFWHIEANFLHLQLMEGDILTKRIILLTNSQLILESKAFSPPQYLSASP